MHIRQPRLWSVTGLSALLLLMSGAAQAFEADDVKQAKETCHCPGCDLSGADFENFNPAKAAATGDAVKCDLGGADFSGARFANVNMQKDSRYTDFVASVNFAGADFRKADLSRSWIGVPGDTDTFEGVNFEGANLHKASLNGLHGANLRGANLSQFKSRCDNMSGAASSLEGADLSGANLDGADLCVYFFNTNLTGATLRDATIDVTEESYSFNSPLTKSGFGNPSA